MDTGGCSSIGRASPCGGECCGFKSRQSPIRQAQGLRPIKKYLWNSIFTFFFAMRKLFMLVLLQIYKID